MKYNIGAVIKIKKSIPMWENDIPIKKGEKVIIVGVALSSTSPSIYAVRAWFPSRIGSDGSESALLREKEFEVV